MNSIFFLTGIGIGSIIIIYHNSFSFSTKTNNYLTSLHNSHSKTESAAVRGSGVHSPHHNMRAGLRAVMPNKIHIPKKSVEYIDGEPPSHYKYPTHFVDNHFKPSRGDVVSNTFHRYSISI